jgi:hypothetical protein
MCYTARPPRGTMLYAIEIAQLHGLTFGDTEFASAQAAWEALPDPIRYRIEGRRAVFDFTGRKRACPPSQEEFDRNPLVMHPIVRTHPYTGKKWFPLGSCRAQLSPRGFQRAANRDKGRIRRGAPRRQLAFERGHPSLDGAKPRQHDSKHGSLQFAGPRPDCATLPQCRRGDRQSSPDTVR